MNDVSLPLLPTRFHFWMTRLLVCVGTVFWAVFVFGQLERVQVTATTAFYAHDVLAVVFLILWLVREQTRVVTHWQVIADRVFQAHKLVFIFLGWAVITTVVNAVQASDIVPVLYLSRLLLYGAVTTVMSMVASESSWLRIRFSLMPLAVGLSFAWFGILQYVLLPDTRFLASFGWDDHYYRMISTLFDPNYLGLLLLLTAVSAWRVYELGMKRLAAILALALILLVLPTFSRGSYATGLLGIIFVALYSAVYLPSARRALSIAIAVLLSCSLIIGFLLPKPTGEGVKLLRTSTIAARVTAAQEQLASLQGETWFTGTGLYARQRNQADSAHARLPDNVLVMLLTQTGIIGVILATGAVLKTLSSLYKKDKIAVLAVLLTLFHSLGTASLLQPFIFIFLLTLVGTRIITQRNG